MEAGLSFVGEASTGAQAIELCRKKEPDVVLMGSQLPDMSGIEAAAAVCREFRRTKVILVSSYGMSEEMVPAFAAGARGFLLKDTLETELFRAIKLVVSGSHYIPAELAHLHPDAEKNASVPSAKTAVRSQGQDES
jgi:DNA-binding NarL/FixJ family response regulator